MPFMRYEMVCGMYSGGLSARRLSPAAELPPIGSRSGSMRQAGEDLAVDGFKIRGVRIFGHIGIMAKGRGGIVLI